MYVSNNFIATDLRARPSILFTSYLSALDVGKRFVHVRKATYTPKFGGGISSSIGKLLSIVSARA